MYSCQIIKGNLNLIWSWNIFTNMNILCLELTQFCVKVVLLKSNKNYFILKICYLLCLIQGKFLHSVFSFLNSVKWTANGPISPNLVYNGCLQRDMCGLSEHDQSYHRWDSSQGTDYIANDFFSNVRVSRTKIENLKWQIGKDIFLLTFGNVATS